MWLVTQTRPALEAWDSKHLILELWSHEPDQPDLLGKQAHKATGVSASRGVSVLRHKIMSSQSWDIRIYWTSLLGPGLLLGMEVCLSSLSLPPHNTSLIHHQVLIPHISACPLGLSSYTVAVLPCCLHIIVGLKKIFFFLFPLQFRTS